MGAAPDERVGVGPRPGRWLSARALLVAGLLAAGGGLGCSGDDDGGGADRGTATSAVTAPSVLAAGAARWAETPSAHFQLRTEGDTFLDESGTLRLVSADGDLARPDSARAEARIGAARTTVPIKLVAIGEDAYLTNLFSGAWERAPDDFGYNPALLFDPERGLQAMLPALENAELTGEEAVEGREARRVTGTLSGDRIADVTAGTIRGDRIDVVVWLAVDNGDLLRVTLGAPSGGAQGGGGGRWDLTISRHGEDVEISAPM